MRIFIVRGMALAALPRFAVGEICLCKIAKISARGKLKLTSFVENEKKAAKSLQGY